MNFRALPMIGALVALAACQPSVPDSGAGIVDPGRGVGFGDPATLPQLEAAQAAQRAAPAQTPQRRAAPPLQTQAATTTPAARAQAQSRTASSGAVFAPSTSEPLRSAQTQPAQRPAQTRSSAPRAVNDPQGLDAELAQIAAQNDANAAAANSGRAVVNASPSNAAPVILNNPGISDENDFDAVASRRSIEGDAARLAQRQQQYTVVQPTALPSRANAGPNIVQYALQTSHARGTRVHRRITVASASKFRRNCAAYNSADEAQIDFLANGGPRRDRKGLDPDGDGFACAWDPAPFRRAAGN
ncbi:MAG: hypothetical protein AAF601_10825 [Pseudomonadota bacterium]